MRETREPPRKTGEPWGAGRCIRPRAFLHPGGIRSPRYTLRTPGRVWRHLGLPRGGDGVRLVSRMLLSILQITGGPHSKAAEGASEIPKGGHGPQGG